MLLNTNQRVFLWAYLTCIFNFAALIFYSFELLDPESVIELFVFVAAVSAGSLVFDLHRYNKEQQVKDQAGVQNGKEINLES